MVLHLLTSPVILDNTPVSPFIKSELSWRVGENWTCIKHSGSQKALDRYVILSALRAPTINQILTCPCSFWTSQEAKRQIRWFYQGVFYLEAWVWGLHTIFRDTLPSCCPHWTWRPPTCAPRSMLEMKRLLRTRQVYVFSRGGGREEILLTQFCKACHGFFPGLGREKGPSQWSVKRRPALARVGAVSWFRPASGREVASKQAPQPGWVRWGRAPAVLGLSNWRNCCEVVSAALAERPVISRWHVCKCWFCGCYLIHAGGEKPRVGGRLTSQRQASWSGLGSRTWGGVSGWEWESNVGASLAHGLRTEKRMWKRSCWQMSAAFIWAIVPVSW